MIQFIPRPTGSVPSLPAVPFAFRLAALWGFIPARAHGVSERDSALPVHCLTCEFCDVMVGRAGSVAARFGYATLPHFLRLPFSTTFTLRAPCHTPSRLPFFTCRRYPTNTEPRRLLLTDSRTAHTCRLRRVLLVPHTAFTPCVATPLHLLRFGRAFCLPAPPHRCHSRARCPLLPYACCLPCPFGSMPFTTPAAPFPHTTCLPTPYHNACPGSCHTPHDGPNTTHTHLPL